jgi:hypothetical protein
MKSTGLKTRRYIKIASVHEIVPRAKGAFLRMTMATGDL